MKSYWVPVLGGVGTRGYALQTRTNGLHPKTQPLQNHQHRTVYLSKTWRCIRIEPALINRNKTI